MSSNEKIDVIDFIINILKEHEKSLDTQIARMEDILNNKNISTKSEKSIPSDKERIIRVDIKNWNEYQEKTNKPEIASFDIINDEFIVNAIKRNILYYYNESISEVTMTIEKNVDKINIRGIEVKKIEDHPIISNGRLNCGLMLKPVKTEFNTPENNIIQKITYHIDVEETRKWLSQKLNIDKDSVINGKISIG
ncbi:hypothetical protein FJY84_02880 [Candidatus Bathyarchaeota archaeon]|nr:hypothetical protein [Candidatus Bathyarchaeota archaeon]